MSSCLESVMSSVRGKIHQAFSLRFLHTAIKNWSQGRPGNEATTYPSHTLLPFLYSVNYYNLLPRQHLKMLLISLFYSDVA